MTITELTASLAALSAAMRAKGYPEPRAVAIFGIADPALMLEYDGADKAWPTIEGIAYRAEGGDLAAKLDDAAAWIVAAPVRVMAEVAA